MYDYRKETEIFTEHILKDVTASGLSRNCILSKDGIDAFDGSSYTTKDGKYNLFINAESEYASVEVIENKTSEIVTQSEFCYTCEDILENINWLMQKLNERMCNKA